MRTRLVCLFGAICATASSASACPTCSVGQGLETLAYVVSFLLIPYVVVGGVIFWMRKLTSEERGL